LYISYVFLNIEGNGIYGTYGTSQQPTEYVDDFSYDTSYYPDLETSTQDPDPWTNPSVSPSVSPSVLPSISPSASPAVANTTEIPDEVNSETKNPTSGGNEPIDGNHSSSFSFNSTWMIVILFFSILLVSCVVILLIYFNCLENEKYETERLKAGIYNVFPPLDPDIESPEQSAPIVSFEGNRKDLVLDRNRTGSSDIHSSKASPYMDLSSDPSFSGPSLSIPNLQTSSKRRSDRTIKGKSDSLQIDIKEIKGLKLAEHAYMTGLYHGGIVCLHKMDGDQKVLLNVARSWFDLPSHPNFCRLIGYVQEEEEISFVTDKCHHVLADHVASFSNYERLFILKQIAACLWHLHAHDNYHGMISVKNILFEPKRKRVYLHNFGLPEIDPDFVTKRAAWLPPEILNDPKSFPGSYGEAADIWSYGVLIWELFNLGEIPFSDVDFRGIKDRICSQETTLPTDSLPENLQTLVQRIWCTKHRMRPSSEEIHERITNFIGKEIAE